MDLYLINGQDGISLPEMIDWDIKLSNPEISEEVGVNSLMGLGYELPSLDIDDEPGSLWAHSYSANSNSSFELDLLGEGGSALMVNPSSIMPFVSTQRGIFNEPKNSEDDEKSETKYDIQTLLTEVPEQTKIDTSDLKSIDNDFMEDESEDVLETKINIEESDERLSSESAEDVQEITPKPFEFIKVPSVENTFFEVVSSKKGSSQKRQVLSPLVEESLKVYPKPGYSYSCLIAMALKNSKKGSLPVSEIYSFMCHHFPYFKTAPNGWKNSVRHNLSLNKCFEKIEKPPGSGPNGSQRKGCLWAMNPSKISKMDEEVAKWSRKDPSAIKNAMVYPDKLELLERGELKDDAAFAVGDAEEDSEETKEEEIEEELGVDVEDERISPIDDDSEDEMSRIPPSLQPFEPKFHYNSLIKSRQINEKIIKDGVKKEFKVKEEEYSVLEESNTRTLLGLDESTPIYAVDPTNENLLIELPIVKRPRVQSNYFYQPMLNMKRHNGFRSVKIESP